MRTSFVSLSPRELCNFNIVVWDILRAVLRLTDIQPRKESPDDEPQGHRVKIRFAKIGDSREYGGLVTFHLLNDEKEELGEIAELRVEACNDFQANLTSFAIPEGFKPEDCLNWLATEVSKLAYAMTVGKVWDSNANGMDAQSWIPIEKDGSFILWFNYDGLRDGFAP